MKKMPKQKGTFAKGGLRQKKVADKVAATVPDVRWWFVATSAGSRHQAAAAASLLFSKENVLAVTDTEVVVIPMKGPGVFGTGVDGAAASRAALADVDCTFEPKKARVTVDGQEFNIYAGHEFEALHVAARCGAAMPDWYVPA